MAFVDEDHRVVRQVFEQRRRRLAGAAPGQIAAVVLDAGATSGCDHHFHVELAALFEALRLKQLALLGQNSQPPAQLLLDALHRLVQRRARRDVVAVGVNLDLLHRPGLFAGERIKLRDRLHLIPKERDLPRSIFLVNRPNIHRVPLHPKGPTSKRLIIPFILKSHQIRRHLPRISCFSLRQLKRHRRISLNRPDPVNARNRSHNNHIIPLQYRPRSRMPHAIDRFVDGGFFLDVRIRPRDIGLGHVVIVVTHEILDGVVGKEALELAVELGCQCLVVGEDQRGALHRLDHLRHRECLA